MSHRQAISENADIILLYTTVYVRSTISSTNILNGKAPYHRDEMNMFSATYIIIILLCSPNIQLTNSIIFFYQILFSDVLNYYYTPIKSSYF